MKMHLFRALVLAILMAGWGSGAAAWPDLGGDRSRALIAEFEDGTVGPQTLTLLNIAARRGTADAAQADGLRILAARLLFDFRFRRYLMQSDSVFSQLRKRLLLPQDARPIKDVSYTQGIFGNDLITALPLVADLLAATGHASDQVVAELLRGRTLFASDEATYNDVERYLTSAVARLQGMGVTDAEMASVLADLWAAQMLAEEAAEGDPADTWLRVKTCAETSCPSDIASGFFAWAKDLIGSQQFQRSILARQRRAATNFFERELSDPDRAVADLYYPITDQKYPIDAAKDALVYMRLTGAIPHISNSELSYAAGAAMETLVYAGKYAQADEIGRDIEARVASDGDRTSVSGRFWRWRARAAFWLDDRATLERVYDIILARLQAGNFDGIDDQVIFDLADTDLLDRLDRVIALGYVGDHLTARIRLRQGQAAEAAAIMRKVRQQAEATEAEAAGTTERQALYAQKPFLMALAWQEAAYTAAAGNAAEAERLRALGGTPPPFAPDWVPLGSDPVLDAADLERFRAADGESYQGSYDLIRDIIGFRDEGNYEGAAALLKGRRYVAIGAVEGGQYVDAQALWQMSLTFLRAGETGIAFELMDHAARIAARLSVQGAGGAGGGTLQLLERDRWRYLMFVDIAWAAVTGATPDKLLVVSRY